MEKTAREIINENEVQKEQAAKEAMLPHLKYREGI